MKIAYKQKHASQLDKILAALPKTAEPIMRQFVEQFYAKMPVAELDRIEPKQAVAVALGAFEFMRKREGDGPAIRIFTPNKKDHGYDSKFPVIELVNNDMPFLVDSLSGELTRQEFFIHEMLHPIFKVTRDKKGVLQSLEGSTGESFIHFEISALPEGFSVAQLKTDLEWVLSHIRVSVEDWRDIVAAVEAHMQQLATQHGKFPRSAADEACQFLRWLIDRNFVFLGYAQYDFYDAKGKENIHLVPGSARGIMKMTEENTLQTLEQMLSHPQLVEITKSARRSPVHRNVPMDYIGVKRFDAKGQMVGEIRLLGLFTSNVYYQSSESIPLVRHKISHVLERSAFEPSSHDGKSLKTILEFLPRDEIFQISEEELFETGMGILALEAKPGVRVFTRRDAFERFVSCMVFTPRERFSTALRHDIQHILERAYNGTVSAFSTQITEAPLARLHLIIKTTPGDIPNVNLMAIEKEIAKRAYLWSDLLFEELMIAYGEQKGEKLQRLYANAFPQGYINAHSAASAVHDIEKIEEAHGAGNLALELFRLKDEAGPFVHLKIYNPHQQIAISDILPMLENAGFRAVEERPFLVSRADGEKIWIRDFKLEVPAESLGAFEANKTLVEALLQQVWRAEVENDRLNALVLVAGLSWRQVVMLRALSKYLKQAGFAQGQPSIEQALLAHADIVRNLVALFEIRFDPETKNRPAREEKLLGEIDAQLAGVTNAVQDTILRRFVQLMQAVLRTNFYQASHLGGHKPVLSFKFASAKVPELPKPHPYAEIFVYSPRVEGIHLRGGRVARGGLRWSDRLDDFRTEVLGLMKAQMVKNSVIVPVGSKGGFVVKRPPAAREAYLEEGVACYKMYLCGLLDVTDNIVGSNIVPPKDVVRHDDDDPYLVVAADKGTATFSDIANGVSAEYGFWLGDAFASGGSVGYDHKKMGITARGGWVSVARHFAEMGVDIATQDFTCVGIGDMAGDVFGNGMLLSPHIQLVAAFNHMHIFIDPTPDAKKSFAERERLFALPRSSWKDYDEKLISKGGGVFERSAKSIELSREAQNALGVHRSKFTPDELIRAILLAPVDLLWNGGIGTYVKAEDENNEQVGDRANNALRVNGKDLRCKIVGEGGNLGFTQKGRIEFARAGGRINTDAIDNSAGVDCSDHEVNIKIAFSPLVSGGKLAMDKRDKILAKMTDEVAALVLKDNILQTQAITIAEHQAAALLDAQQRLMHRLEKRGLLDRAIEYLPNDKQITELKAAKKGLTRPEIAVLLSYSKMELYRLLLESSLPDEDYFLSDLKRYFPKQMQAEFDDAIQHHRLKREIIATVMTNSIVNRAGITFYFDIAEDTGATPRDVAAAYALARDAFNLRRLWQAMEEHAAKIPPRAQAQMYGRINLFLERACVWLLGHLPQPIDVAAAMQAFAPSIAEIEALAPTLYSEGMRRYAQHVAEDLLDAGVPQALADAVARLDVMASALDIIEVAKQSKKKLQEVGRDYFALGERFGFDKLRQAADRIATVSHYERMAQQALMVDLYNEQRRLSTLAVRAGGLAAWLEREEPALQRFEPFLAELKSSDHADIPRLMVALRHIRAVGAL